jgi:hypothetical protein
MKLSEMIPSGRGDYVQYRAPTADRDGQSHYEIVVQGPKELVKKMFAGAEFSFEIDSEATQADVEQRAKKILRPYHEALSKRSAEPWLPVGTERKAANTGATKASRTVTVAVRRTAGQGTFWHFNSLVPIPIPAGATLQVVLPFSFTGGAISIPAVGNPNLFIRFNSATAPIFARNINPGTAIDAASFVLPPWINVFPFFQFLSVRVPSATLVDCWGFGSFPF